MTQDNLIKQLEKLHQELQNYQPDTMLDEQSKHLLEKISQDIEKISRSSSAAQVDTQDSLENSLIHFEQDHPTLSAILKEMLDILNKIGI